MRKLHIPKGKRSYRLIYIPSDEYKLTLKSLMGKIQQRVNNLPNENVIHGFFPKRSPVTNALQHVGFEWTVSMDLKDFFLHCDQNKLKGKIKNEILKKCLVDNHTAQGLPTSPSLANLAASNIDDAILKYIKKIKKDIVYTRYADDMTFSGNDSSVISLLIKNVNNIVTRNGFKINKKKTQIYYAKDGKRIVTGVAVGKDDIKPTRKMKRKLRAAKHHESIGIPKATRRANGLYNWCQLHHPKQNKFSNITDEKTFDEIKAVCSAWNIKLTNKEIKLLPNKGDDIKLPNNCIITGDPIYMLGMSTYTTGWKSCMAHPNGSYRKGSIGWCFLRGTRIATLLDKKNDTHGGVKRLRMKARCLLHKLRNGVLVYDRFYGSPENIKTLKETLIEYGVLSISEARHKYKNEKVIGQSVFKYKPYFDNMKSSISKSIAGPFKGKKVRVVHL